MTTPRRHITDAPFHASLTAPASEPGPRGTLHRIPPALAEMRRIVTETDLASPVIARRLYQVEAALTEAVDALDADHFQIGRNNGDVLWSNLLLFYSVGRVADDPDNHIAYDETFTLCGKEAQFDVRNLDMLRPAPLCAACAVDFAVRVFDPKRPLNDNDPYEGLPSNDGAQEDPT